MAPSKFFSGLLLGVACFSSLAGASHAQNLTDVLATAGFTAMAVALEATGIAGAIAEIGDAITVFAPDNAAFDAALTAYPNLDDDALIAILAYHITGSEYSYEDLIDAADAGKIIISGVPPTGMTSAGYTIDTDCEESSGKGKGKGEPTEGNCTIFIRGAMISGGDILFDGGIIQEIDAVIVPPSINITEYA